METDPPCPFDLVALRPPAIPLVLAVPHSGQRYPAALASATNLPIDQLRSLEDRHVDRLVQGALDLGATAIIARNARAWIDLNRDPRELDPAMIDGPSSLSLLATAKMRGGLGLIPRRLSGIGDILNRRLKPSEVRARIEDDHVPYHAAIADALAAARARFGIAILLDCHSMPPLADDGIVAARQIIVGDRYGRSAHERFAVRAEEVALAAGLRPARNLPYAGGYTLDRHGKPRDNVHALQIEIDRSLYLEDDMRTLSPGGSVRMADLIGGIAAALADEAIGGTALAAE
jgi:N-formylglutamate amidohydrolase